MLLDLVGMFSHRESSEVCSAVKPTGCQQFVWFHLQAGEARRRSALQVRRRRGAGRPVRSELEGSGRSEVGVAVSPSPAASSARSLRPNISPRLQRKQRRRAMSVTCCRSDVRSEEIKPADVHLTSCYFHRSSLISDFKLKTTKTSWCLGVKSKFDLTGSWASTEWTWAHRALTTHVVNVPKWPSTPQTVPDVNMMHSDSFSLRAASV